MTSLDRSPQIHRHRHLQRHRLSYLVSYPFPVAQHPSLPYLDRMQRPTTRVTGTREATIPPAVILGTGQQGHFTGPH